MNSNFKDFPKFDVGFDGAELFVHFEEGSWKEKDLDRFEKVYGPIFYSNFIYKLMSPNLLDEAERMMVQYIGKEMDADRLYKNIYSGKWNFETDDSECYNNLSEQQLRNRTLI